MNKRDGKEEREKKQKRGKKEKSKGRNRPLFKS